MKLFTRKKEVPSTNELKEIDVVQLWSVRWTRRFGQWHTDTAECAEFFTSEKDAEDFYTSLANAFKLLKHKGEGTAIAIRMEK